VRCDDPNREYLLTVADAIGALRSKVVFVGGSVAGLLVTDPIADGIRATKDVDAVIEATTLSQYHQVEKRLSVSGFKRDVASEVICRWRHTTSGVLFDLMPTDPATLGLSNRWYPEAMNTAARPRAKLSGITEIRRAHDDNTYRVYVTLKCPWIIMVLDAGLAPVNLTSPESCVLTLMATRSRACSSGRAV